MNWLKRFWSCRVMGAHVWGKAVDYDDSTPANGDELPHGRYKTCRHCGTVRAVRRRKGKG